MHDRVSQVSQKPAFVDDDVEVEDEQVAETEAETPVDDEPVAEGGEAEAATSEEE